MNNRGQHAKTITFHGEEASVITEILNQRDERIKFLTHENAQLRKEKAELVEALNWALSVIAVEPYEWTCDEDSIAHHSAVQLLDRVRTK